MCDVYYGLKAKPFDSVHNLDYFYQSFSHEQGLYYLRYGIQMGEGILVVTGVQGSGKRMLVRALLPELAPLNAQAGNVDAAKIGHDNALRLVADGFGISCPQGGNDGLHNVIKEYFVAKASSGKQLLLVVENAERLSQKLLCVLRVLTASFQAEGKSLLQVVLLGQPVLHDLLYAPGMEKFSQGAIAPCHLRPLTPVEMRAYIEHHLTTAGWAGQPIFTGQGLELVYCCTGGIPGLVNVFCDRVMQFAWDNGNKKIYGAIIKSVLSVLKSESPDVWGGVNLHAVKPLKLAPLPDRRKNRRQEAPAHGSGGVDTKLDIGPSVWISNEINEASAADNTGVSNKTPANDLQTFRKSEVATTPLMNFQREFNSDMPLLFDELPPIKVLETPVLISMVATLLMVVSLVIFLNWDEKQVSAVRAVDLERPPEMENLLVDPAPVRVAETTTAIIKDNAIAKESPVVAVPPPPMAAVKPEALAKDMEPDPAASSLPPAPVVIKMPERKVAKPVVKIDKPVTAKKTVAAPQVVTAKEAIAKVSSKAVKTPEVVPVVAKTPAVVQKSAVQNSAAQSNEMQALLEKFVQAYNNGNIGALLNVLSSKVEIDNSKGKYLISQAYVKQFQTTESRSVNYDSVSWREKDGIAVGKGRYKIEMRFADGAVSVSQGDVNIELITAWDGFRVNKIDHLEDDS